MAKKRAAKKRVSGKRVTEKTAKVDSKAKSEARAARVAPRKIEHVRAMEWVGGADGHLSLLDQTLLPDRVKRLSIRELAPLIDAIRRLAVRGAPAIGCAAAYGVVIGLRESSARTASSISRTVDRVADRLAASRPTAVNLFWAIDRMRRVAHALVADGIQREDMIDLLLDEALAVHAEDQELCRAIGDHGSALLPRTATVLTHCNAGALATGGCGTALAVIYRAAEKGKRVRVLADETRPLLQGARLTSWELAQAGIDVTVLCDNAAASILRAGEVDCVVVGADRIARNGDTANKIGTYGLAVLAREHRVPFYVAAPTTTLDPHAASGADIPIEERSSEEVVAGFGQRTAPRGVTARNPAFDVTPAKFIRAIITEKGVIEPPFTRGLRPYLPARRDAR